MTCYTCYLLWLLLPITVIFIGMKFNRYSIGSIFITIGVIGFVVTLVYLSKYLAVPHDAVLG